MLEATSEILNLEANVIEKDYYVTQVIHALSSIKNNYFQLIFAGGTCLSKAHKLVKRMSEDVDYKIQVNNFENFTKSRLSKELKDFRSHIQYKIGLTALTIGEQIVRNEGRYLHIEIDYPTRFSSNANLRPHILLEFTVSDTHLPLENISIKTLIEDTLEGVVISPQIQSQCIAIEETAAEKWVGLTRRIMAIERGYHADDKVLIRHVYDLNAIKKTNKITDDFFSLIKKIIERDSKQFKNQHPEFSADPISEIKKSLVLLKEKSLWKERYIEFIETMVYEDVSNLEYFEAINVLDNLSEKIINSLHYCEV